MRFHRDKLPGKSIGLSLLDCGVVPAQTSSMRIQDGRPVPSHLRNDWIVNHWGRP